MAGNRIHKFGTIATRVEGLLRSGAMAQESAPIWLSVYKAFPPHVEPRLDRPVPDQQIRDIVYHEDFIRARFYDQFGSVGLIDSLNQISKSVKSVSQMFVDRYIQIARTDTDLDDDQLFERTTEALTKEGVRLYSGSAKSERTVGRSVSSRSESERPSISSIALSND